MQVLVLQALIKTKLFIKSSLYKSCEQYVVAFKCMQQFRGCKGICSLVVLHANRRATVVPVDDNNHHQKLIFNALIFVYLFRENTNPNLCDKC